MWTSKQGAVLKDVKPKTNLSKFDCFLSSKLYYLRDVILETLYVLTFLTARMLQ
jgi:hypothetical protein